MVTETVQATEQNRFLIPAWGISLAVHGTAVWLALTFVAQVRPVLQEEIFKWDVALVDAVKTEPTQALIPDHTQAPTEQVVRPVQPETRPGRPRPVEPSPDTAMHRVAPQQTVQMVHPQAQPTKPVEQREEPVPPVKTEPATPPVKPVQEKTAEPVEQQTVEAPKSQPEPVTAAKDPEPLLSAEPIVAQRQPASLPQTEAVETRPLETPAKPPAPQSLASSAPAEPAPTVSSPPHSAPEEAPMQTAKAAPGPDVKVDHRWIAESLWRRVAELKRYPSSARLNGQEGKVILKAVIRADGHLAEVSVLKSSGHQILDAAAIEAVKLACPLHMKHAIGKPEIVVSLPIVYSLAN